MSITETQNKAESLLYNAGILPVVTVDTVDQARRVVGALLEGGLTTIELTLRTPVALEALATLKREQPEITIGAGTVLNEHQLRQSIDAGADFLITPGTPPTLAQLLADAPIPAVPGAATATELLALMVLGFHVCKLFPANVVGGLHMLTSLAGPLTNLKLCPTGGINETNASDYLAQPNVICIGGSWMVPKDWLVQGHWDNIKNSSSKAAAIIQQARSH
ncbi:bifunctional 4-hydroxy-2-oxoglutarate aldolase/2-dehydro-3-deoxy-phosphogluconate aldolase [Xylella fastidiosa subsp. fastidiosa]|jgi:2-dehydro-3-deoxyphosphogluconate aldolase/(4S)-4-hydroxy-2-oxoglutarate aldolase|uniref:2-dehydro-3-deoxy-phosphogluconate aldolase n=3 Tax=Xylella fastidiosa TaxID=2371 RepID=Q87EG9_XYLFT|nr:bifunctional 4-hydroxy-2-oxoglutarate aldolase/2-dehydro-3-deoxy-phosphogluconate aldolase [Xylella fastidiosa]ADN63333.1 keto-hydroxyglutarate-aldolase/keto-deoxy-phosphogluconate aldolase [Xylella fastidiosa subsp. fastidiosa GB514]AAO28222.1 2-keto-3-deoxy-6-phosphogluconate aldolase [Xylella fastidiosa Temecula1]ACB91782.1 2-dehydro-3-deoxyphosphogluconate aldolase/4-hydroxy-2-oxoglutarate aldolase [Xylella fastidiosa M23]EGO81974.1 2-keto-3-deoxy-6-phosphogluconate aldolase Eda [Xylella